MDEPWAWKADATALPVLRLALIAGVAVVSRTSEIENAVKTARRAYASVLSASVGAGSDNRNAINAASAAAAAANENTNFAVEHMAGAFSFVSNLMWEQLRDDLRMITEERDPLQLPLWSITRPDWFTQFDAETRAIWSKNPPGAWDFWSRWWDGVLSGKQLDWELQRRVALIPDEDWQRGPAHIAAIIVRLEEQFALRTKIAELKETLRAIEVQLLSQGATAAQRSHNHPPELVDAPTVIGREVVIAMAALDEAETELAKFKSDPLILNRVGSALLKAAIAITKYWAGLADVILTKSAEVIGDTGTKAVIAAVALNYAPQFGNVGRALLELAAKLAIGG